MNDLCCCGHPKSVHIGGPDLTQAELESRAKQLPQGDGGMCRAHVENGRCDCFNFCDCDEVMA